MASTARAYRNPEELKSANFAPAQPSPLERRILASRLPGRYSTTFRCFVAISKQGPDFFGSTFKTSKEAQISYRTAQRHLDWLEGKVLKLKHEANKFYVSGRGIRRTATYVLHEDAHRWLAPRETAQQWCDQNRRQTAPRKRAQNTSHSSTPPASVAPSPAPQPQPVAAAPAAEKLRQLNSRDIRKLAEEIARLMKGHTKIVEVGGYGYALKPDDPRYVKPMSRREAVEAACKLFLIPLESAIHALKLAGYSLSPEPEDSA